MIGSTSRDDEISKSSSAEPDGKEKRSYWAHMVSHYEKRNATLEQRQSELAERLRLMECALPSVLMGAMVSMKRGSEAMKLAQGKSCRPRNESRVSNAENTTRTRKVSSNLQKNTS